jgi:adenosine deaminase
MDGIPDPGMLRHLEAEGIQLGMSADALAAYYPVAGYDDFVRWFQGVKPLEGTLEAYQPLLAIHFERLKAQHVIYTEIMIAGSEIPRDRGELVGRVRAFREWTDRQENGAIQVEYLAAFGRNRTAEQAEAIADRVLMLYGAGLIAGVALAGPERGHPVRPLQKVFARFREAGLGIEIHAGEWCGPESVWDALENGFPDRIGHGVTLFDDPALIRRFQEERIHVEMCPTSNVKTGSVRCIEDHPVRRARDLGLNFAINTDDPGAFECSMTSECQLLADVFGFEEADFAKMKENALGARFQRRLRGPNAPVSLPHQAVNDLSVPGKAP